MGVNKEIYTSLKQKLDAEHVTLVAVSKTKPVEDILSLYQLGQRHFGENYVQELTEKQAALPADIHWHFIGHLQGNKVKYIAPFIHLIHGVDSYKLLQEIDKQAFKNNRVIDCLLQVHIASEETKFGLNEDELEAALDKYNTEQLKNVRVAGLMGMASFSENMDLVKKEFTFLKSLFNKHAAAFSAQVLSMGMSGDYAVAIEEGSTMVRIGSLLFGARNYNR